MTFTARCISALIDSGADPRDDDAVTRAFVEAGIRPDETEGQQSLDAIRRAVWEVLERRKRDAA